jgi:prepilin-type N-terminal cleavage/methylation domain-containing protein
MAQGALTAGVQLNTQGPKREWNQPVVLQGFTLVELMITMGIMGLLVAVAAPNFVSAREKAQRELCIHNLQRLDAAKATWALKVGVGSDEEPSDEDLEPEFRDQRIPLCPAGGTYTLGLVSESVTCSLEDLGHFPVTEDLAQIAESVLEQSNAGQDPDPELDEDSKESKRRRRGEWLARFLRGLRDQD